LSSEYSSIFDEEEYDKPQLPAVPRQKTNVNEPLQNPRNIHISQIRQKTPSPPTGIRQKTPSPPTGIRQKPNNTQKNQSIVRTAKNFTTRVYRGMVGHNPKKIAPHHTIQEEETQAYEPNPQIKTQLLKQKEETEQFHTQNPTYGEYTPQVKSKPKSSQPIPSLMREYYRPKNK
jgi:hypothetical protein